MPRHLAALALIALASCAKLAEDAGGEAAEAIVCPTDLINCGLVYVCEASAGNDLGHVEICVDDGDLEAAEAVYGSCEPTPRHQGLCYYHCDGGRGCNAFNGCFCPPE